MDWQQIAVYLIVTAAVVYLTRRYLSKSPSSGGCGSGCGKCGSSTAQPEAPVKSGLVQIDLAPSQHNGTGNRQAS